MNPELVKVKALLRDPAFWTTIALPALRYFDPRDALWLAQHWQLLAPYAVFMLGHMGIRIAGVNALSAAVSPAANPPTGAEGVGEPVPDVVPGEVVENG